MKALSCLLLLILFGCSDNGTEPATNKFEYPSDGVWAGWSDLVAYNTTEPYAKVQTKIDLDLDRLLWGNGWHEMEWEIRLYGTPPGDEGGVVAFSWGRCDGVGHLEGVELVAFLNCDNAGFNADFRGTRE